MEAILWFFLTSLTLLGGYIDQFIPLDYLFITNTQQNVNIDEITNSSLTTIDLDKYNQMVEKYNFYMNIENVKTHQEFDTNSLIRVYPANM